MKRRRLQDVIRNKELGDWRDGGPEAWCTHPRHFVKRGCKPLIIKGREAKKRAMSCKDMVVKELGAMAKGGALSVEITWLILSQKYTLVKLFLGGDADFFETPIVFAS